MWAVDGVCDETVIRWHIILLFPKIDFFMFDSFDVCFEEIQISVKKSELGKILPKEGFRIMTTV